MGSKRDTPCAICGELMWSGKGILPEGQATCLDCRRSGKGYRRNIKRPSRPLACKKCRLEFMASANRLVCDQCTTRRRKFLLGHECIDCGGPSRGERCRTCSAKARRIRADGDNRHRRLVREQTAPGLSSTRRKALLAKWKKQRKVCIYCSALANTIDHVIPLVRGGTNHEGNLVPCCRQCNSAKAGRFVVEWRTGKRLSRMAAPLPWSRKQRKPMVLPIAAIGGVQLDLFTKYCIACSREHQRWRSDYCSDNCQRRARYRRSVGAPVWTPRYKPGPNRIVKQAAA
jgi:hypothetical protein